LSAPSGGTLIVRLDWDPSKGSDDIAHLMLIIGECAVPPGRGYPSCPSAQRLTVQARWGLLQSSPG